MRDERNTSLCTCYLRRLAHIPRTTLLHYPDCDFYREHNAEDVRQLKENLAAPNPLWRALMKDKEKP